ncbi:hypothetical protein CBR_g54161 [Chara braunii]|uniref:Reverse transcriptase RNase H-like domain-containing protein n=1 Tax=Chara braunii TaxID=69332 RepID=A0A388MBU8_CHABU|nr:hypothetical protein CBR_g54161 [Chara braunii]|eukprot:GBG92041.1 hypothetical protein CBR_g54161 [Chara braunii]
MPKKVKVTDMRRKLAEIEKKTAEYKERLIEEMMTGHEEGPLQEEPQNERKASQGGTGQGDKGCTVNKEGTGSIRGASGEIPFAGYVTKCVVKAGVRESIWSFQRMRVMEEMNHDIILGRPWCTNVEMIGMHLHDGSYMVDIEDHVTGRGELLRLLGTGGEPPKGKLAIWSPSFEDSTRKGAFAWMEGMRERVEIMIEEAFNKKEWIKMGLPQKKRRQEDEVLGVMVAEKESEVELGASLPKRKEVRIDVPEIALEIPDLLQLIKALRYHKVGVNLAALAKFEREVQKGYCLNGKLVSMQPRVVEATGAIPNCSFFRRKIPEGSIRKYKSVGKKAKPVSILLEASKEEAIEKEEEVHRVIRERRTTEGHRIPDNEDRDRREAGSDKDRQDITVVDTTAHDDGERRYSQFKKEVLAILHCLKTFHAYLFGRRFILRIDPTNVAEALKNYRPIDPTVGRWVGFIWQFDYKIERIAGIRNKADGLSRVCITPEGMEDAEPIDAFLEYEGGTLAVDNEMISEGCTSG